MTTESTTEPWAATDRGPLFARLDGPGRPGGPGAAGPGSAAAGDGLRPVGGASRRARPGRRPAALWLSPGDAGPSRSIPAPGPGAFGEPLARQLEVHGTAVLHARIDEWAPTDSGGPALRRLLGADWGRYRELTHPEVRARFAASRAMIKHVAARAVRVRPEAIELGYSLHGRPYLRGCDQVDISLSHTDDLLLIGLTTRGLIGVDAEAADRPLVGTGAERLVCTPRESALLAALPEPERNPALVRLWTLKEAYSKAIGQGLRFRFTEFGFEQGGPGGGPDLLQVRGPDGGSGPGAEWSFGSVALTLPGYAASFALRDAGFGAPDPAAVGVASMADAALAAAIGEFYRPCD
ncbi:4'-phosphopantetheinyl transferase family protein [Kitasatospora fiedleri]|uniref:4'-phosphopantetheinyl transferase family protein n=1 Tax=Kitasatospora fiedleri TaxID=2991545 RepID=UPI00249C8F17|nr:4'-phosphopantetheinyl transferase superfamily protein [Kitasatospora fiedleri]